MNDRYLFRAKRIDNGEWVEGGFCKSSDGRTYMVGVSKRGYIDGLEVIPETICQCTGLKDKNGKLIWENDVVRYCDCTVENYVIAWESDKACFEYQQYGCSIMNFDELSEVEVEVIGNIFDNPELINE